MVKPFKYFTIYFYEKDEMLTQSKYHVKHKNNYFLSGSEE